ncbi:MAG TPA: hypothetical protein VFB54_13580 [Burkholderiales bacterium]|nr:hypothetical protein [Burkholderiales bacterium]
MADRVRHQAGRLREVIGKGSVAVLDEGLFAGSNFLIGILLARWLGRMDYGAFTTAYSLFLLLGTAFYSTLCVQPVLVFGSRDHATRFGRYFGCVLGMHVGLTAFLSLVLAAIAAFCWYDGSLLLAKAFGTLAIVAPCITLLWLSRGAHYALLQPHWPLCAGALYLVLIVLGSYALFRSRLLSPQSSLLVMGAASLASSLPLIGLIGPQRWVKGTSPTPSTILAQHWQYGRWSALTSSLRWSTNYAYYLLLPLYLGLEASAVLRAHMNLILPILHVNSALYGILIPQFTRTFARQGRLELWRFVRMVLVLYAVGALIFWAALTVFAEQIFALLYSGQYQVDIRLFALLGLLPLSGGIAGVLESALLAAGRPKLAPIGYAVSALMTLTVGWGLLMRHGVVGAGMGMLTASVATAATMVWLFIRWNKVHGLATPPLVRTE